MAGIDGVGYVFVPHTAVGTNAQRRYTPPEDFKPGLIFPEKKDKTNPAKTAGTILSVATATVLAYVFRGKIKAGAKGLWTKIQPYCNGALKKGKNLWEKGVKFVSPYIDKCKTFVTNLFQAAPKA